MTDQTDERIELAVGDARATIAIRGAEPVSWRIGDRELLWHGDPAHWSYSAPLLFPLVGASKDGKIRVGGRDHPMPQHGFARTSAFTLEERSDASARLVLMDNRETLAAYPYRFALEVTVTLTENALRQAFTVTNRGEDIMAYGLGIHPAFPWPLDGDSPDGHRVIFDKPEVPTVPEIAPGGLLSHETRKVPVQDAVLPLSSDLFAEALVFLDAQSHGFAFTAPSGASIRLSCEELPHLAVWSKPGAPFLSLEAWSSHADWQDASGKLSDRASMTFLKPGETAGHRAEMSWSPPRPAK